MPIPGKDIIFAFFTNTSIRGFNRIVKTNSAFLRFLWILFVISTITFLVVSIFKVVIDYRQYSVNIQTYIQIDNATPFPAVTFCNHQPFSYTAYKLWNDSTVLSPTKFNELLRIAALKQFKHLFRENQYPSPSDFQSPMFLSVFLDKIAIYYQSLPVNVTEKLGHDKSIIKNCIWSYDQIMAFDNECLDDMLQVKTFSHPLYFNCHTVSPKPEYVSLISKLGLIIWLGPDENTNIQYRQGFLFDIFEQAYGLRVVIHEPGSYPNIESQGIQIEPGRLNELNYQPVLHVKVDTDRKPCVDDPKTTYRDLSNEYIYDIDLCFNMAIQEVLITECKCIYGYFPRYLQPGIDLPYCGFFDPDKLAELTLRRSCVRTVFEKAVLFKSELKATKKCIHRCKTIEYETTTSVTKWRPTDWQFYWLKEIVKRWVSFEEVYRELFSQNQRFNSKNISVENYNKLYNLSFGIEDFLVRKNLSKSIPNHEKLTFNDRYTFLVIKRKANNTFIKEERLVLTFNALVSRVGGLCSLYIGLTFAFFIELVDFLYTAVFLRHEINSNSNKKMEEGSKSNNAFKRINRLTTSVVDNRKTIEHNQCAGERVSNNVAQHEPLCHNNEIIPGVDNLTDSDATDVLTLCNPVTFSHLVDPWVQLQKGKV